MLQRIFSSLRSGYGLTVFFLYIAAFGLAFIGTVTLPVMSIGVVLISILLLVPAVLLGDLIGVAARAATRPYLRRGVCPKCRAQQGPAWEPPIYRCAFCPAAYEQDGDPYEGEALAPQGTGPPDAAAQDAVPRR